MAQRYGDKPNVIYEIYNEPTNAGWSSMIKPYSEAVIAEIRKHDPDNIIVCGTPNWSQRVDEAAFDPITKFENIAYSLHFYAGTHKQSLRNIATTALNKGIALFVTEFGTCDASGNGNFDPAETQIWWQFLDENKISWCNWSVADKDETASVIKPGSSVNGGWSVSNLTASGALVRSELRMKNPPAQ